MAIAATTALGCPTCGGGTASVTFASPVDFEYGVRPERAFRFLGCRDCGSEWLDPRPTDPELCSFYPAGYHAYNDDHGLVASVLVGLRARLRARQYRAVLGGRSGRVFDVGAGDCRHFEELRRHLALECGGVEINPDMAAKARARGYDIETGTLEQIDLGRHAGRYDVVSMNHVLEHVVDPREVVEQAFRLLRPGGKVMGQLPTSTSWEHRIFRHAWAGYHFPRHLQVFTRAGLTALLTGAGLRDVRLRATPHCQIAISIQNRLVERGWTTRLRFGRAPYFGVLLLATLPLEVVAAACGRAGVIDFEAKRPRA